MKKSAIYAIVGAGGFGREIMPVAYAMLAQQGIDKKQIVFVDDSPNIVRVINGHSVLSREDFFKYPAETCYFNVTIADYKTREKLASKFLSMNARPFSIKSINALDFSEDGIGKGAVLAPFSSVSVNVRVGDFFHADRYASLTHDCVAGNFVTLAPKAQCNGGVCIEDYVYIGSGAIIRNSTPDKKITIGRGAVIGMGAVVTKSVPAGATVVGNPARILEKS